MYAKKGRTGNVLIKGISRKRRENFKQAFKPLLKSKGISIRRFDQIVLLRAMQDPMKFI